MALFDEIAIGLGYLVGMGAFLLYAPIAIRILRLGRADGLAISTWWIKIISYTFTLLYSYLHHYLLSTYIETLIISIESFIVLFLVAYYQNQMNDARFFILLGLYIIITSYALNGAFPMYLIALGQTSSIYLNCAAIFPQLHQNYIRQSSGDYSPVTASLAVLGCAIRIFTTIQLNNSDQLLLLSYAIALFINAALLAQICYFGVLLENQTLLSVFTSDIYSHKNQNNHRDDNDHRDDNAVNCELVVDDNRNYDEQELGNNESVSKVLYDYQNVDQSVSQTLLPNKGK